jgi:predicted transcriptional regulator
MMPKGKDGDIAQLSVLLPKDLHEKVTNMAKEHDLSIAWVIRYIIADFINNDRKITIGAKD